MCLPTRESISIHRRTNSGRHRACRCNSSLPTRAPDGRPYNEVPSVTVGAAIGRPLFRFQKRLSLRAAAGCVAIRPSRRGSLYRIPNERLPCVMELSSDSETEGLSTLAGFQQASPAATIPPSRLRRATSLYTREAMALTVIRCNSQTCDGQIPVVACRQPGNDRSDRFSVKQTPVNAIWR